MTAADSKSKIYIKCNANFILHEKTDSTCLHGVQNKAAITAYYPEYGHPYILIIHRITDFV
jgi:hypothetical protein